MRESEAKTKWCPLTRKVVALPVPQKYLEGKPIGPPRYPSDTSEKCKGSDCMMWRSDALPMSGLTTDGHCGLAGTPTGMKP